MSKDKAKALALRRFAERCGELHEYLKLTPEDEPFPAQDVSFREDLQALAAAAKAVGVATPIEMPAETIVGTGESGSIWFDRPSGQRIEEVLWVRRSGDALPICHDFVQFTRGRNRLIRRAMQVLSEWQRWAEQTPASQPAKNKASQSRERKSRFTDKQETIISALLKHHEYESGDARKTSCLPSVGKTTPATYRQLCDLSGVKSSSTVKAFFAAWLPSGGNAEYQRICKAGAKKLSVELARLVPGDMPELSQLYIDSEA